MSFDEEPQDVHGECRREIERLKTISRGGAGTIERLLAEATTSIEEIENLTQSEARWRELAEALDWQNTVSRHVRRIEFAKHVFQAPIRITAARKAIADAETEEESPNE